jgi:hypothetical protein
MYRGIKLICLEVFDGSLVQYHQLLHEKLNL